MTRLILFPGCKLVLSVARLPQAQNHNCFIEIASTSDHVLTLGRTQRRCRLSTGGLDGGTKERIWTVGRVRPRAKSEPDGIRFRICLGIHAPRALVNSTGSQTATTTSSETGRSFQSLVPFLSLIQLLCIDLSAIQPGSYLICTAVNLYQNPLAAWCNGSTFSQCYGRSNLRVSSRTSSLPEIRKGVASWLKKPVEQKIPVQV